MEGFRQYLGKTITLGTKKCGPGECFVGTFYTINLAEGLFVFKDVRKKTPKEVIQMKQPFVGFKLDDVTSFQLDLFANAQAAAPATTEAPKAEEPSKPEPAVKEPAVKEPVKEDAAPEEPKNPATKEPEKRHKLNIQRSKSPSQAETPKTEPAAAAEPEPPKPAEAPAETPA